MKLVKLVFAALFVVALQACSDAGASNEPVKTGTLTCEIEMSEVKWFWGEICPIGQKEKWVSVGHSYTQSNKTTGCVQLKNTCSVNQ